MTLHKTISLAFLFVASLAVQAQTKDVCVSEDADIARDLLLAGMETDYYQVQRYEGFTLHGHNHHVLHIKLQKGFHYRFGMAAQSDVRHYLFTFHNGNCSQIKELSSNDSPNHNIIWFDYVCEETETITLEVWAPHRLARQHACAYLIYARK